ncbi:MAG: PLDc_N domain-containing protein [Desulfobulbaceae bacterium]|nr:PLDc_N domain-containing protein [Desulfobulbaceae bacterium]
MDLTSIGSVLLLIADIYAIVMILQSSEDMLKKILWSIVVIVLPLIGLIVWYLAGPGKKPF